MPGGEAGGAAHGTTNGRSFGWSVAVIALLGFAVRLTYAVGWRFEARLRYDGPVYRSRASFLLAGRSFVDPDAWFFHHEVSQGAVHPPGNTLWLALGDLIGFHTDKGLQVWGCLLGTATIVVIALLGREVRNARVGLVAAAIAAFHPGLWSYDPTAMAETPGQFCTAVALLLAYRFWRSPTVSRAAWLGAAVGLGAMCRSELAVLFPVLVIPLVLASRVPFRAAALRLGAAVLWMAMITGPWIGWNMVRFEKPVTLASGIDVSLAYAQCPDTWYGDRTGYWNVFCGSDIPRQAENAHADESEIGAQYRARAGSYIADHLGRWPVVMAARVGRTLSLYRPVQQIRLEHNRESREVPVLWGALVGTAACGLLGAVALVRPPRSRRHLLPLLAPLGTGIAGAAITFGTTRYRSAAEVGLVVLAAVGVDAIATRRRDRRSRPPEPGPIAEDEPLFVDTPATGPTTA